MNHWLKRSIAAAAALVLTGCLWTPGKFGSELSLRKDGSFVLDYRGEIILQLPPDMDPPQPWDAASMVRCHRSGKMDVFPDIRPVQADKEDPVRTCTAAELAKAKAQYERQQAEQAAAKRKQNEEMAKAFGLPGLDDESNRAFAARLSKYAGWRSVRYRGNGIFDVDYHFEGRASQDFAFPMLPDTDVLVPFVAIRRRSDGSVLVTAPAMTGGGGPLAARAGRVGPTGRQSPQSRASGRFTVITDGEVLTNNSEDGAAPNALGRQLHWDVTPASTRIPETLIRLR